MKKIEDEKNCDLEKMKEPLEKIGNIIGSHVKSFLLYC